MAFLANQLHQVAVVDDPAAGNPVPVLLPLMLALTTSMVGLEYPKHLFVPVISGSISTFVSILCDEFLFFNDATSAFEPEQRNFF
jgi:hypothetical protein